MQNIFVSFITEVGAKIDKHDGQRGKNRDLGMDLCSVARCILPERSGAKTRVRICEPADEFDRDQRHVLFASDT